MENNFVHLHLHTEFSLLDGVGKLEEYIDRAKELGMEAIAITDHGNMFGAVSFYQKAIKKGIKPIIGLETYMSEFSLKEKEGKNYHLILLAKNEIGYKNLMKISSTAYEEGFYYKPRIDREYLKEHKEGLIVLSACMSGEVPKALLNGDVDKAYSLAKWYKEVFGEDYYIELQNNGFKEQEQLNDSLFKLAKDLEIEVVGTNDVHYVHHGDHQLQEILLALQTGTKLGSDDAFKIESEQLYLKSREQMSEVLGKYHMALENTKLIADKCNLQLDFGKFKFPAYDIPSNFKDSDEFLEFLVKSQKENRYGKEISKTIDDRIEYELSIIKQMGYAEYFIVVWDFIDYAKKKDIPIGPGRGSAAGSIVAYLLGITNLDPIKYNLIFERFLNPERISMPDIDIDICQERRHEVIEYVSHKYGRDKVAQIITFGTMKARAAIRDVGRVMDVSLSKVDKLAKMIPNFYSIDSAISSVKELRDLYLNDYEVQKLLDFSKRIEGKVRHASIHAAGVVITKDPLVEEVPLYFDNKNATLSTQYQMKELEDLGLLKMDFLGLRNLTIIKRAIDYIKSDLKKDIDIERIKLDDKKTYDALAKGDSLGVFQLESDGMIKLMRRLKPNRFEDIVALLALYRPGPLGSGMVDDYINVKNGLSRAKYPHDSLKDILEETYGVILYQEQVMNIAHIMANYSLGEADLLRRAMGKKIFEIMEENREKFVKRSVANGYTKDKAEEMFDLIDKFAGYGFNKSHSAAYALVAYWTAYLKINYPAHYFAALMSSEMNNISKLGKYIVDGKSRGIIIKSPSVNNPSLRFTVKNGEIIFGMAAIKNLGDGIVKEIILEKENGEFKSFDEFVVRMKKFGINKKSLEALILSGSLDELPGNRRTKYNAIGKVLEFGTRMQKLDEVQQMNLFGSAKSELGDFNLGYEDEFGLMEMLQGEKEYIGLYISGHPLDRYKSLINAYQVDELDEEIFMKKSYIRAIGLIRGIKKLVTKKSKEIMAVFTLEDFNSSVEVVLFPKQFIDFSYNLIEGSTVYLEGNVRVDSFSGKEEYKFYPNTMIDITELQEEKKFKVYILVEGDKRSKLDKLKTVIKNHPGNNKTFIAFKDGEEKSLVELSEKLSVSPSLAFLEQVETLLGDNTVLIK